MSEKAETKIPSSFKLARQEKVNIKALPIKIGYKPTNRHTRKLRRRHRQKKE
jgi:hypothetical protein